MENCFSNPINIVLQKLQTLGKIIYPSSASDVKENGDYVYMVSNGSNVLQIGKGKGKRITKCMRGGLAGKHNKAFICALGELVLRQPNTYAYVVLAHDCIKDAERELHKCLGVETNQDSATLIEGVECRSITGIHKALWTQAKDTDSYQMLDPIEQLMAEELFEVVTFATTKIQRSSGFVSSRQGDNLEGNILNKIGKRYLINVFIKLTDGYLRYGKHCMQPKCFEYFKQSYHYIPHGKPFDLKC